MKAWIAVGIVGTPALLALMFVYHFTCKSTLFSPFFVGGLYSGESMGPPFDLDGLVWPSDSIVYGEVVSAEHRGFLVYGPDEKKVLPRQPTPTNRLDVESFLIESRTFAFPLTTTTIRVLESHLGDHTIDDLITISEMAPPRPFWRVRALSCNRNSDIYHLREASRKGDRRLWFIHDLPEPDDAILNSGPFGRLDIESDTVLVTTTRPVPIDPEIASQDKAEFMEQLKAAIERKRSHDPALLPQEVP